MNNIIYVGGKAYDEQHLLDMIDFYENNYIFPKNWNQDVSSQILKHYPFYPRISKSSYRPELYYNQYCQLDITFKEFIDYVIEEQPDQIQMMFLLNYNPGIGMNSKNI